jgi:hypothetical protein
MKSLGLSSGAKALTVPQKQWVWLKVFTNSPSLVTAPAGWQTAQYPIGAPPLAAESYNNYVPNMVEPNPVLAWGRAMFGLSQGEWDIMQRVPGEGGLPDTWVCVQELMIGTNGLWYLDVTLNDGGNLENDVVRGPMPNKQLIAPSMRFP